MPIDIEYLYIRKKQEEEMDKLKTRIFFIAKIAIAMLPWSSFAQPSIGGYSFSDDTAIISFRSAYMGQKHLKIKELLWVDFIDKKTHIIDQGTDINWRRVNRDGTRIAYLKGSSFLRVYDLNEKEIMSIPSISGIHFYWTENPNVLAGVNAKNGTWFVLNLQEDDYQEVKHDSQRLWGVAWSPSCSCVEFEVSDESYTEHYLLRMEEGEIKKTEGQHYLSRSPDGRYIVFGKESAGDDGDNQFIVIDNNQNMQRNYYARSPIGHEQILWGSGVVRILFDTALLNLETGELANPSMSSLWKDRRPRGKGIVPIDLAADSAGYVLRWDMDKKLFLVEDVNAGGKIIKTYEKFWGDDGGDAEEESGAKKP